MLDVILVRLSQRSWASRNGLFLGTWVVFPLKQGHRTRIGQEMISRRRSSTLLKPSV